MYEPSKLLRCLYSLLQNAISNAEQQFWYTREYCFPLNINIYTRQATIIKWQQVFAQNFVIIAELKPWIDESRSLYANTGL